MKTGTQFKVKDYEEFKEAMKVYTFKNPRIADERFHVLGYRYVTKFPTHIDISQRIEHYELIDNPLNTLFCSTMEDGVEKVASVNLDELEKRQVFYKKLEEDIYKTEGSPEEVDSVVDEDTGLHYVKESEEAVDWDNVSETFEEFKKSGIPMEVLVSNATKFMTQKDGTDKLDENTNDGFMMSNTGEVKFMTQKEFMDRLNGDVNDEFESMLSEQMKNLDKDLKLEMDKMKEKFYNSIKPKHYEILGMEVKDINEELLNKIQASDFDMTLNEAGWYQQAMQYFFRFYAKNGVEDLEKGIEAMRILVTSLKSEE